MQPRGTAFRTGKADGQHLKEDEKAGDLGAGGDERGARRGRTLVDIRRPEVEREGGDLKAKANHRGDDGDQQKRVQRRTGGSRRMNCVGNARQAGRIRQAIEQAEAEQQKRGGHSAEEKIFQRGFRGVRAMLVERGEDVEGQAQQFERNENHQQILRADQEHAADSRDQNQQNKFADVLCEAGIGGHQQRDDGEHEQRNLDKMGKRVGQQCSVKNIRLRGKENNAHNGEDAAKRSEYSSDGETSLRRSRRAAIKDRPPAQSARPPRR